MIFGLFGDGKKRNQELRDCASEGNLNRLLELLKSGADVNDPEPENGETALNLAVNGHHVELVGPLLKAGANINQQSNVGNVPLFIAAIHGDEALALVEKLLAAGADVNLGPKSGENAGATPLYVAATRGANRLMERLLKAGASTKVTFSDGSNLMHAAASGGNDKTVQILSTAGVDFNAVNHEMRTPLHNCVITGNVSAATALIRLGAPVDAVDAQGCTPLLHAVLNNRADVAKVLLDHDANPDISVRAESTTLFPLHVAVMHGQDEMINMLIEKGADATRKVDGGHSLADLAKQSGHESSAKLISAAIKRLRAKPQVVKSPEKQIALIWKKIVQAVTQQDVDALRKLTVSKNFGVLSPDAQALAWVVLGEPKPFQAQIIAGANPNKSFDDVLDGMSLLYAAVGLSRNIGVVRCLVDAGANPNLKWKNGATPIFEALTDKKQDFLKLLIDNGADVNAKMTNGQTPLIMASANNSRRCVDMLLDAGADIDQAMPGSGLNAFSAAVDRLHMDLALHLIERGAKPDFGSAETLGLAVAEYGSLELIHAIETKGGSIIRPDQLSRVAFVGSRNKDYEVLDHLLSHGANLSQDNDYKYTPLILSVLRNHPRLVQRYLERGDDPSIRDVDNETALSLAIESQREGMVSMLRKFKAEVGDYSSLSDQEAMLNAAQDGNLGTILNLHDAGVSLNVEDSDGNSPMLLATKAGHLGVVRSLYHLGADINHRNHAGLSATKVATSMIDQNLRTTMMEFVADDAVPEGMEGIPLGGIHDIGNMLVGRLTHPGKENPPYDSNSADGEEVEDDETAGDGNEEVDDDAPGSSDIDEEETLEKLKQLESLLGEPRIASKFDDAMLERITDDIEDIRTNGSSEYQPQIRGLLNLLESLAELEEDPLPPLFQAIGNGDLRKMKQLLNDGAEINSTLPDGTTSLMTAAENGHNEIVLELIKLGVDVNQRKQDSFSAFLIACFLGHDDVVKTLAKHGADVNAAYEIGSSQGKSGNQTALTVAAARGNCPMCALLLKLGADLNIVSDSGYTPLMWSLANGSSEDAAELLLKAGANPDPDAKSKIAISTSTTPLILASTNGMTAIVKALIKRKVAIDKTDGDGWTALKRASNEGYDEVVKLLLKAGASPDIADHEGWTALINAAGKGHVEISKALLKAGADVNATGARGRTPLLQAIGARSDHKALDALKELKRMISGGDDDEDGDDESSLDLIEILLKAGANPNVLTDEASLLSEAFENDDEELAKLLRKHGATESALQIGDEAEVETQPESDQGTAFLAAAIRADAKELRDLVLSGVDVNYRNAEGQTALVMLLAALQNASSTRILRRNAEQCIDYLLSHGANPNIGDPSPFVLAAMGRKLHLVQAMISAGVDINKCIGEGQTALFMSLLAPDAGQPVDDRCALALLKAGADCSLRHESGAMPIHLAAGSNYIGALQELLDRRPQDIDAKTNIGITPLMMGATEGHAQACELLLKFGANRNTKDDQGLTAKDVAIKNGNEHLVALLS